MMGGRVMVSPVVGIVEFARAPVDAEVVLAFVIAEPMEFYVHGFGLFGLDFSVNNALSG